jgi:exodeoxyribonuclease V gamma subunit
MLRVVFSNRFEVLQAVLLESLEQHPADPFAAEQVIIPGAAMRRSLELAIARRQGICAGVEFSFLAQWLWRQVAALVPGVASQSPFAVGPLAWRIVGILADTAFVARFPRLAHYLAAGDPVMRYELALELARLIEQYTTWRPDWTEAWGAGQPAALTAAPSDPVLLADLEWQAALCQRVLEGLGVAQVHPMRVATTSLERVAPAGGPSRVHVVCVPSVAPLYLGLLQRLSAHSDVTLLVLNPCEAFWHDIVSPVRWRHLAARGQIDHHETGHRLLSAWGQQTRSHVEALFDVAGDEGLDEAFFVADHPPSRLGQLQASILQLRELMPGSLVPDAADRSIEIHVCHSLTRQIEVLHDQLLGILAAADPPSLDEILVVMPDIDAAAPIIDSIFGTAPAARRIPYTLAGTRPSAANPAARALLDLLRLLGSRFLASEVLQFLHQPMVARRFGLAADELETLRLWFDEAGIRWGIDAAHRAREGLPAEERFSFRDGIDRLLLGYALPDAVDQPFDGRNAAGQATGAQALVLGALCGFVDEFERTRDAMSVALTPSAWVLALNECIERFLKPVATDLEAVAALREGIRALGDDMTAGGHHVGVPLGLVQRALTDRLDDAASGSVVGGAVTFASMASMRGLPFRHLCIIGLDDGAFPAPPRPDELDLMRLDPRKGDRARRDDDRNLFLDLILAARERLYLSYTGLGVRDNQPRPPSVLVAELLDYLAAAGATDPASVEARKAARARLLVMHPLQAFSIEYFEPDADPRRGSHEAPYCSALIRGLEQARALAAVPARRGATQAAEALRPADHEAAIEPAGSDEADEPGGAGESADLDEFEVPARFLPNPFVSAFFDAPLEPVGPRADGAHPVSMTDLAAFFADPANALLRRRLDIDTWVYEDAIEDDEPFLPDARTERLLAERLVPRLLEGCAIEEVRALAMAGIEYPGGAIGEAALARDLAAIEHFARAVRADASGPLLPAREEAVLIDADGASWALMIGFGTLRPGGLVMHSYREHDDRMLIRAWIHHLCLNRLAPSDAMAQTVVHLKGRRIVMPPLGASIAEDYLARLLARQAQGLCMPLHFYPRSAMAWAERATQPLRESGDNRKTKGKASGRSTAEATAADTHTVEAAALAKAGRAAAAAARKAWEPRRADRGPLGESEFASVRLAMRGEPDPLDDAFLALAREILWPLFEHVPTAAASKGSR